MGKRLAQIIHDYYDGVYGRGPFYFVDPLTYDTNVLPKQWAYPSLTDVTPNNAFFFNLLGGTHVNTPANDKNLPAAGVSWWRNGTSLPQPRSLFIPLPEGHMMDVYSWHTGANGGRLRVDAQDPSGTSWTGTPNNSASILTENGIEVARNHVLDPRGVTSAGWTLFDLLNQGLLIRKTANAPLPPGHPLGHTHGLMFERDPDTFPNANVIIRHGDPGGLPGSAWAAAPAFSGGFWFYCTHDSIANFANLGEQNLPAETWTFLQWPPVASSNALVTLTLTNDVDATEATAYVAGVIGTAELHEYFDGSTSPQLNNSALPSVPFTGAMNPVTIRDSGGITLQADLPNTNSTLDMYGMRVVIYPEGKPRPVVTEWSGGQGHSGVDFDGPPTYVEYNGVDGGQVGVAATFREVGSWRSQSGLGSGG